MSGWGDIVTAIDFVAHETTLFACIGFLMGGIDDLIVDLLFFAGLAVRRIRRSATVPRSLALLPPPSRRLVLFVPAWDESRVIGHMLAAALKRFDYPDYAIYVGTYPNDQATIEVVADVAARDPRVRLVVGDRPGPSTKAECLNWLWQAMLRDEAAGAPEALAVVLHDAEDVVHPSELRVYAAYAARHDVVQIPVLPLADPRSPYIAGHYLDEFAEAHGKQMPVRGAIGAGLPLAGVGCAIRRSMLATIAHMRNAGPFDPESLTEDYELGLTIRKLGGRGMFARVAESPGGPPVAVRAYFPATIKTAVRQKTRWMVGIALAGWDRTGWAPLHHISDHWMRLRDRRALLAVLVLMAAYSALVVSTLAWGAHLIGGDRAPAMSASLRAAMIATFVLLVWRLGMRSAFVARHYGRREALRAVPRAVVSNIIAMLAARRALVQYVAMLRGGEVRWDKTSHHFPADLAKGDAT
ncbi:glycosyl transferase family protein [Stakelama saccharophila]|uniref:Glycosyl transferase family protein n=1 Tax=Stakelama saccharophila TaxID=3075605 RepID=A0ABZ0BB55_9SPHN|nr:glycosyl transferase family protein [Stakelama sp. W311]WNO54280.1 glycosyl transferase family protein [Stakelama sp. W311]